MKKKVIALLLSVAIVTVMGCGNTESASNEVEVESTTIEEVVTEVAEEVAEETVAEEVATTEEVVEEVVLPTVADVKSAYDTQKYIIVQETVTDTTSGTETYLEYLINRESNVVCAISGEDLSYYDLNTNDVYMSDSESGLFYKMNTEDCATWAQEYTDRVLNFYFNYYPMDSYEVENIEGTIRASVVAGDETTIHSHEIFVDSETGLPFRCLYRVLAKEGTIETDTVVVEGESMETWRSDILLSYPVEGTEDFETFKAATALPTDEECTSLE